MAEEREAGEPEIELKEEDEEVEADSREGDGVWVREEKWYPSLRRYLESRNCENCYKDGVKVLDMIIRQSRTSHDLDSKSNGSTTHCSEYSEQPPGIDVTDVVVNKAANLPPTSPRSSNQNKKLMLLPPAPCAELTPKSKPHNKGPKSGTLATTNNNNVKNVHKLECPPPPPQEEVRCVFCKSLETRFEHYNNHKVDQPRYRCTKCKRRFTYGGKLRNKRLKLCVSNNESTDDTERL